MKKKILGSAVCSVIVILGIVREQNADLRTDDKGLSLIANSEGCRAKPYQCSAHVLTVGIGSTMEVKKGKTYTNDEIAKRFITDVRRAEQCVNTYANGAEMNQGQFNAITSFVFNVGCRKKSTLFRYAHHRQWRKMCDELPRWSYVNGKKSKGIEMRRFREWQMCVGADDVGID